MADAKNTITVKITIKRDGEQLSTTPEGETKTFKEVKKTWIADGFYNILMKNGARLFPVERIMEIHEIWDGDGSYNPFP